MPTFRPDLESIPRYVPGRPIDEVARELGIESIDKLASNESPEPPFPAVIEAVASAASTLNRYPQVRPASLQARLAALLRVAPENLLVTRGSSEAIDALVT